MSDSERNAEREDGRPGEVRRSRDVGVSVLDAGLAADGAFRWVAVDLTSVTREAQVRLDLGPVATVAWGRAAACAAMLLHLTSKTPRRLILDIRGSGPLSSILIEVGDGGAIRGLVGNPHATGRDGELDVAGAIGIGLLRVRREEEQRNSQRADGSQTTAYESQVELATSEIGGDLAYYLQQSEQRRSAVAVGVEVSSEGIHSAAGLLVEAMPGASERAVAELEQNFPAVDPVTSTMARLGPSGIASSILPDVVSLGQHPLAYHCRCSEESLSLRLASLPPAELASLSDDDGIIPAECGFCGEVYRLSEADLLARGGGEN